MKRRKERRMSRRVALFKENADTALRAVKSNRLRASLTIAIIALGITSLVGILTAVDSMDATLQDAYGRMGAGIVNIRSQYSVSSSMRRIRNPRQISRAQAERFVHPYTQWWRIMSGRSQAGAGPTPPCKWLPRTSNI